MYNQIFKLKGYDRVYTCVLRKNKYVYSNSLCLSFVEEDSEDPYGTFTKCIPDVELTDKEYCAWIDINNWPLIESIIKENKLGEWTGRVAESGYCNYPEYKFKKEIIDNLI